MHLSSKSLDSRVESDLGVISRDGESRKLSPSFGPNGLTTKSCKSEPLKFMWVTLLVDAANALPP